MRYIRIACIIVFAVALAAVALANRNFVQLQVLPDEIAGQFAMNPKIELPLFIVILGSIIIGLLVGFVWEWFREHAIRADSAQKGRDLRRLERENSKLKAQKEENRGDDVLALLDEAS
ncbi:MAG: LapA family protein [Paracoccaceae bacterium]